jgi:hypothetical protein
VGAQAGGAGLMRWIRAVLVATGVLVAAWGGWLLRPEVTSSSNALSVAKWLIAGSLLHDLIVAPVVALVGLLVARTAPRPWRVPVITGLAVSGVLVLVGLPVLLRPSAGPPNPGLADRHYLPGLLVALAVIWVIVAVAGMTATGREHAGGADGFVAQLRRRRRQLHRGRRGRTVAGRLRARLGGPDR